MVTRPRSLVLLLLLTWVVADGENLGASPPPPPQQPIGPEVIEVLQALYESTGGSSWKRRTNWLNGRHPCGRCNDGSVTPDAGCGRRLSKHGAKQHGAGVNATTTIPSPPPPRSPYDTSCSPPNDDSWYGVSYCSPDGTILQLKLDGNRLTGTLPSSLGRLGLQGGLVLGDNQLSGTLPAGLLSDSMSGVVELDGMELSGTLPSSFAASRADDVIGGVRMGGTGGTGMSMAPARGLLLSRNRLSGSLPTSLLSSWLLDATTLRLDVNRLSGTVPSELAALRKMTKTLSLGSNALSGQLPAALAALRPERCVLTAGNAFAQAAECAQALPEGTGECALELQCRPPPSPPPPPPLPHPPPSLLPPTLPPLELSGHAMDAPRRIASEPQLSASLPVVSVGLVAVAASAFSAGGWLRHRRAYPAYRGVETLDTKACADGDAEP